jgi:hypothetical protein
MSKLNAAEYGEYNKGQLRMEANALLCTIEANNTTSKSPASTGAASKSLVTRNPV